MTFVGDPQPLPTGSQKSPLDPIGTPARVLRSPLTVPTHLGLNPLFHLTNSHRYPNSLFSHGVYIPRLYSSFLPSVPVSSFDVGERTTRSVATSSVPLHFQGGTSSPSVLVLAGEFCRHPVRLPVLTRSTPQGDLPCLGRRRKTRRVSNLILLTPSVGTHGPRHTNEV